jgi:L,D-transpeptidase ErfK/SrfK
VLKTKRNLLLIVTLILLVNSIPIFGNYAYRFCSIQGYTCIKVRRGDTWNSLWPDKEKRRIVMRLNRRNLELYPGLIIAVPNNLMQINHMDISPLPYAIKPLKTKAVVIDIEKHAFGAYDINGYLIHWGPVSAGKGWCPDIQRTCESPRGTFFVISKGDAYCISEKYPVPEGGAPMPFCMYFFNGYAMHAGDLPGLHASHGCIRMFYEDAEWLNKYFVELGPRGTIVIVK